MNGKKTKALRRLAEELTPGMPARKYKGGSGPVAIHPRCTRAVYQSLKHRAKGAEL